MVPNPSSDHTTMEAIILTSERLLCKSQRTHVCKSQRTHVGCDGTRPSLAVEMMAKGFWHRSRVKFSLMASTLGNVSPVAVVVTGVIGGSMPATVILSLGTLIALTKQGWQRSPSVGGCRFGGNGGGGGGCGRNFVDSLGFDFARVCMFYMSVLS